MAKCKFKVGDRVKATKDNHYGITGRDMEVGIVTEVGECGFFGGNMRVRVLKHKNKENVGFESPVKSRFFEKVCEETIVLYRKDNKVIALDKSTGKKAEAHCNPADEFDFHTGAKLAFKRLIGEPEEARPDNPKEVKRPAEVGEFIKIVDEQHIAKKVYENGDIGKVVRVGNGIVDFLLNGERKTAYDSEYVVLENYKPEEKKEPFKPYLSYEGKLFGIIGEETPMKDVVGRSLRIGDTVDLFDKDGECYGEKVIVNNEHRLVFVMGIAGSCERSGKITGNWKIVLKRRHEEIKDGEEIFCIKYIKTER